jgi:rare lipoprotein A
MNFRRAPAFHAAWLWLFLVTGASQGEPMPRVPLPAPETGYASVYSEHFNGKNTASGERYDSGGLTAAHRRLALGTEVRVTDLDNGTSVRVRINDRGPHVAGRIIDLSSGAASALGMHGGVARVKLEVLSQPPPGDRHSLP